MTPPPSPGKRETFEQQLARVAAGAPIATKPIIRKPAPEQTLGGIGSAAL